MSRRVILQTPDAPARAGWTLDDSEILRVKQEQAITLPLVIRFSAGRYTYGSHRVVKAKMIHRITVSQDRTADEANETLWHELWHARQAENWARENLDSPARFYRLGYQPARGRRGASYMENAYEIDARKYAEIFGRHFRLVCE